ncbi:HtaA domain-containing protein [Streptomyces sp. NBC_01754]|uniref:HtaA domain-containing protein n=1 Tax=Streptomyces sp. NBC_01754 TaxID=2975930 RepID=UPI002DDACA8E|nr:HtaA domain-containing protein [Streptomyces sp. NBC_01754]WSC92190.1 HtaA domain-containing protein [Streptomyces sp. NBC_01754]
MAASRRPIALAAAVATAAALGATFALPALAADNEKNPAPVSMELTDGTLDWGFKESFRRYIGGAGTITVKDGATQAAGNGAFTFGNGKGTYDMGTHATATTFDGSVNFSAHGGVLDITLSDVKVSTTVTGGAITADVKTPDGTEDDVALAELDLSTVSPGRGDGGAMVYKDIPATLTKAGSEVFNSMYAEGAELDPATLSVKAVTPGPEPTEEPTAEPSEEPSQEPSEKPSEEPSTEPSEGPSQEPSTGPTASAPPSPSASATAPGVEQGPVVAGNLDWGVKDTFRTYVTGPIANGKIETSGGATASGDGYRFPDATGEFDAGKQTLNAEFDGAVRFLGHEDKGEYALDISLSKLRIQVKGSTGSLLADVSTKDRETKKVSHHTALTLAELKLPAGELAADKSVVTLKDVPATLTADGNKAFGGMYPEGESLDPLTVTVALDKDAVLPGSNGGSGSTGGSGGGTGGSGTTGGSGGGTGGSVGGGSVGGSLGGSGSLASTGSDIPTGALIAASGVVVAAGAGVVIAARRRRAESV